MATSFFLSLLYIRHSKGEKNEDRNREKKKTESVWRRDERIKKKERENFELIRLSLLKGLCGEVRAALGLALLSPMLSLEK